MKGYSRIKSFNNFNEPSSHHLSSIQSNEANDQRVISPPEIKGMKVHDAETDTNGDIASVQNKSHSNATPKFQRTCSVSSSMQMQSRQMSMKRTFSIRRSSSISEGYRRIHDQHVAQEGPTDVEDEDNKDIGSAKKERKTKRVLKACKRIFGL